MGWRVGVCMFALAFATPGCDDDGDRCEETREHQRDCGWIPSEYLCLDQQWLCTEACTNQLSCEELEIYYETGRRPPVVSRCQLDCNLFRCDDGTEIAGGFQCDGNVHCLDRSDERDCEYVECNGELGPTWYPCGDASWPVEQDAGSDAGGADDAGR